MSGNRISRRQMIATCAAVSASCDAMAASSPPHVTAVAFSPDGKQIVAGSQAGVSIRSVGEDAVAGRIATELENVHDICFSPDGQLLAVAGGIPGESGVIEIVDWPSGELRQRIEPHGDVVYQVDFAADGSRLVSASADEVCAMNVIGKDRPAARFTQHSRAVLAVTMLPDGETAVSASRDETLRVWNTKTGENLRTLHNHSREVHALALQPGSGGLPLVASASADGTVRFWQPTIGRMVRFVRLPSEPLSIAWVVGGDEIDRRMSRWKSTVD